MSESKQKVEVSIWCRGPNVLWKTLTPTERLSVMFRTHADDEGPAILADAVIGFGECGPQVVELDMSNLDDIYPNYCLVCDTDMNWDMKAFYEMYPQYRFDDPE